MGTALLSADSNCDVSVDGEALARVDANQVLRLDVRAGTHLFAAHDGQGRRWQAAVDVRQGEQTVVRIDLINATRIEVPAGMSFLKIPAGQFRMGCATGAACDADEVPPRTVRIPSPLWVSTTEVSAAQYKQHAKSTNRPTPVQPRWSAPGHPVVNVTWEQADGFCRSLGGRLPTEVEWEYIAQGRAAVGDPASVGNIGGLQCCSGGTLGSDSWPNSSPVLSHSADTRGLHDILGNVWEWCGDWYGPDAYAGDTAESPSGGSLRVTRGGAWTSPAAEVRITKRNGLAPSIGYEDVGFRCVSDHPVP